MTRTHASLFALLLLFTSCGGTGPRATYEADVLHVSLGDEPFAVVHAGAIPRPFVHPLLGPGGVRVTRSFPMAEEPGEAKDHPHHQSFWFAHGDVEGFDFWHGKGHGERIALVEEPQVHVDGERCSVRTRYQWLVSKGHLLCSEERELVFAGDAEQRTVDVSITLEAGDEPVTFGDTKEGSFALRLHPELRVEGEVAKGTLTNSEGQSGRGAWGKRARWIQASGTVEGVPVGVVILDHPANPRHPTWWHARTYGLVAANPFGVHDFEKKPAGTGDLTLAPGESLRLRYRVLLHGAGWDAERVERAWGAWAEE